MAVRSFKRRKLQIKFYNIENLVGDKVDVLRNLLKNDGLFVRGSSFALAPCWRKNGKQP